MLKLVKYQGSFEFLHEEERLTIFKTPLGWRGRIIEGAESLPEDEDCTPQELFLHISPPEFWEEVKEVTDFHETH